MECPKCHFDETVKLNEREYKCRTCGSIFTLTKQLEEKYTWQSILSEVNKKTGLNVLPDEKKELSQKFKVSYSKEESKGENYTIDYESTPGAKSATSVKKTNGICKEVVLHLLNEMDPPEFTSAAFKIQECVEKELAEVYKIDIKSNPFEMFNQVCKDSQLSHECQSTWDHIRQFINRDQVVNKIFPNDQAKKNFFLYAIELFETNQFLKKK